MNFSAQTEASEGNSVALSLAAQHVTQALAGQHGSHAQLAVVWQLQQNTGWTSFAVPYQTAIGDLEVVLEEASAPSNGYTQYEVIEDHEFQEGNSGDLLAKVGHVLFLLVRSAAVAAASLIPFLSILPQTLFDLIGSGRHKARQADGILTIHYYKRWSFVIWQKRPGGVTADAGLALLPTPGLVAPFTLAGKSTYRAKASAQTGSVHFVGPLSRVSVNPTGKIDARVTFTIEWT